MPEPGQREFEKFRKGEQGVLSMTYLPSLFTILFVLTGCADFRMNRSYLSEMEQEDDRIFDAGEDFPILAGDSGEGWRNDKELSERTPASAEDLADRRAQSSLTRELKELENTQPENAFKLYQKYRDRLGSTSEKIYFLKLRPSEREEYLRGRSLIEDQRSRAITPFERMSALRTSRIMMGMSKDDVAQSFGRPLRVEIAGNPSYENERWVYTRNGATKYVYFESGKVEGWE
jgi:hypothetical protein